MYVRHSQYGWVRVYVYASCRSHFQSAALSSFGIRLKGNASSAFAFKGGQSLETWNYLSSLKWEWWSWWRWGCQGSQDEGVNYQKKNVYKIKREKKEQNWNGHWQLTPPIIHLEQRQKFGRLMKFALSSAFVLFAIRSGNFVFCELQFVLEYILCSHFAAAATICALHLTTSNCQNRSVPIFCLIKAQLLS